MRISAVIFLFFTAINLTSICFGQTDTALHSLSKISTKHLQGVNNKLDKYSNRITSKTEKTLTKLSKWENKIHNLLQKADPATADRLFGNGAITFSSMLQKFKEGKIVTENYKAQYDDYRDKLTTGIRYMDVQKEQLDVKLIKPLNEAKQKIKELDNDVAESEVVTKLMKERKQQLLSASIKYIGKSKYLTKINKESYYYAETMRNYKDIFNDPKKAEETALTILNKIPAFTKFVAENSMLASLFGKPADYGSPQSLAGLQTRTSVNNMIQDRIAAGGPNAAASVSQNIQQAQAELQNLKDKILKAGGGSTNTEMPDFKPNNQKSKTLKQRLEFGSNFQFGKPTRFSSSQANIGLSIGYKMNDKSTTGFGVAYKMGYGNISHLRITHEGLGLRSFIDYKLKKQFFVSGGFEMNYATVFTNIRSLQSSNEWQSSGLIGITKKIKLKTKYVKGTNFQLLYDVLYKTHAVPTQPIVFRTGYNF